MLVWWLFVYDVYVFLICWLVLCLPSLAILIISNLIRHEFHQIITGSLNVLKTRPSTDLNKEFMETMENRSHGWNSSSNKNCCSTRTNGSKIGTSKCNRPWAHRIQLTWQWTITYNHPFIDGFSTSMRFRGDFPAVFAATGGVLPATRRQVLV